MSDNNGVVQNAEDVIVSDLYNMKYLFGIWSIDLISVKDREILQDPPIIIFIRSRYMIILSHQKYGKDENEIYVSYYRYRLASGQLMYALVTKDSGQARLESHEVVPWVIFNSGMLSIKFTEGWWNLLPAGTEGAKSLGYDDEIIWNVIEMCSAREDLVDPEFSIEKGLRIIDRDAHSF